ncbi:hypothetical protein [Luteipulveratus mongoliensis]|uniref:Uncharacterized protein n=1 Tax=Luteipulveratus mongoliensis TaxID=571913 RepID=A0A0K1JDU9_9MICO|nr:hypothetical protein [Luteipulveratus mongoliensis]AKU14760.1 hypothetical protein VV02_00830 [Luteipulveratus mongoliensis]
MSASSTAIWHVSWVPSIATLVAVLTALTSIAAVYTQRQPYRRAKAAVEMQKLLKEADSAPEDIEAWKRHTSKLVTRARVGPGPRWRRGFFTVLLVAYSVFALIGLVVFGTGVFELARLGISGDGPVEIVLGSIAMCVGGATVWAAQELRATELTPAVVAKLRLKAARNIMRRRKIQTYSSRRARVIDHVIPPRSAQADQQRRERAKAQKLSAKADSCLGRE